MFIVWLRFLGVEPVENCFGALEERNLPQFQLWFETQFFNFAYAYIVCGFAEFKQSQQEEKLSSYGCRFSLSKSFFSNGRVLSIL